MKHGIVISRTAKREKVSNGYQAVNIPRCRFTADPDDFRRTDASPDAAFSNRHLGTYFDGTFRWNKKELSKNTETV